ncbi:tyrosine-type recombinase/integrase [Methanolobus sp. ZRKC3]|uniref:tyrosine-type recombinase/integrase n=1 Tax=Methanolobus sp. ZRKC3 TaxID=3125786 RepID=UPI0032545BB2
MDYSDLKKDQTVIKLFTMINPADSTKLGYLNALKHYTNFTGLTPGELIEDAKKDIHAGLLMPDRTIFIRIPGFRQYLQDQSHAYTGKKLAPGTISGFVSKIVAFYNYFYIETPKQPRNSKKTNKSKKENLKRADKDLIRQALSIAGPRETAMILIGISSGMASAEIASLNVQQFWEGYDPDTEITTFDMRRRKVGVDFITFISPEASRAIIKYLEWRDRAPSGNEQRFLIECEKRKVTDDSYIFIKKSVSRDYLLLRDEDKRKLKAKNIRDVYARLSAQLNAVSPPGVFNLLRSHNMRKYFNTTLKNEGLDGDLIEYFMGHQLDGSKDAYFEGNPEKLKSIYQKYVPHLTISKELDISESPEYQKIVSENEVLTKVTAQNVVKLDEMTMMNQRIEQMQQDMQKMAELTKMVSKHPGLAKLLDESE